MRTLRAIVGAISFHGVGVAFVLAASSEPAVEPLVHYDFDEPAPRIANSGTLGTKGELRMYDGIGVNAQMLSEAGAGIKGRALMIAATHGDFGSFAHGLAVPFKFANAFTITGWVKRTAVTGGNLVSNAHDGKGFNLALNEAGSLVLTVSDVSVASRTLPVEAGVWMFFAAVWEMTAEGKAFGRLYTGGASFPSRVTLVGSGSSGSPLSDPGRAFLIGNTANKDAPFHGLIDELRIYGAVLNVDRLEALRKSLLP